MKRYDVWDVDMRERCQESPDGNWVAYEDAEAEVSRLNASRTLLHEHIDTIDGYNSDLEEKYDEACVALKLVSDAMRELRPICTDGGDIADVLDSFIPAVKAVLEGRKIPPNPAEVYLNFEIEFLKRKLAIAVTVIEGLADQQAMSDNWYEKDLTMLKEVSLPVIYLNPEESLRFAEMLLNPPEPNEELRKLMQDDE